MRGTAGHYFHLHFLGEREGGEGGLRLKVSKCPSPLPFSSLKRTLNVEYYLKKKKKGKEVEIRGLRH